MDANGPIVKHNVPQTPQTPTPHKKKHAKHHGGKHHRKSRSGKKKTGFLCCRGKKRRKSRKGHGKSKSTAHKQPRSKVVKPLPPVVNEQLGDVVLVKNLERSKSFPIQQLPGAPQSPNKVTPSKASKETDKDDKLQKSKSKTKLDEKSDNNKDIKDEKKDDKKEGKKEEKKDEKKDDDGNTEEKKQKWLGLAKRFVDEDANIAANDFEQVVSYIPPSVTKHQFVKNMHKNRFADVICLDHSKVHLSDSSYIHASYLELDTQKRAILTQLPLPHTSADFWQMIIEQRVKCVLLLLTDSEYDSLGGDFVFPRNQDFLNFEERSIRVGEFKRVEIMDGWVLKVVSVSNGDYKSFLHIHHYNAWPHNNIPGNGSPKFVKQIWQLQSVLRKYSPSTPTVYMSLSGCGRAGTFALFETAHLSLHSEQATLDLVKCLEMVRNGRIHACQNLTQFSFVYTLLAEHILDNGFCKLAIPKKPNDEKDKEKDKENEDEINVQMILRQLVINKC